MSSKTRYCRVDTSTPHQSLCYFILLYSSSNSFCRRAKVSATMMGKTTLASAYTWSDLKGVHRQLDCYIFQKKKIQWCILLLQLLIYKLYHSLIYSGICICKEKDSKIKQNKKSNFYITERLNHKKCLMTSKKKYLYLNSAK